ncbi:MAG: LysM domain-containing protein, partial [Planctomycetota bacterium]
RYTVRRGDTLYSIVRRAYGVAPASLIAEVASVNGLEDPAALDVGRELVLPEIAGHRPPEDPGGS